MADLYIEQKALLNNLSELIRNYSRDGKDRKSDPEFYGKKLKQLDDCWNEFEENDTKIRSDSDVDMAHEYFVNDTYDRTKDIYEKQREKILKDEAELKEKIEKKKTKKATTSVTAAANTSKATEKMVFADFDEMKRMQDENGIECLSDNDDDIVAVGLENRGDGIGGENANESVPDVVKVYFFLIKEAKNAIFAAENMNVHETQGIASAQLENLKIVWNDFRLAHREISVGDNNKYGVNMSSLQLRYFAALGKLNDMMNGNSSKQSVQLPKIKIPEFDGEARNWRPFKDLFDKIVHNNSSINESIKMQYLKSNLVGKAAKMVEHLPPTATSYKTCYELLNNQYENERENVSRFDNR